MFPKDDVIPSMWTYFLNLEQQQMFYEEFGTIQMNIKASINWKFFHILKINK